MPLALRVARASASGSADADELGAGVAALGQQRQAPGAAAHLRHPSRVGQVGLFDQPAVVARHPKKRGEQVVEREDPVRSGGREVVVRVLSHRCLFTWTIVGPAESMVLH
jgi:hypothetical protein